MQEDTNLSSIINFCSSPNINNFKIPPNLYNNFVNLIIKYKKDYNDGIFLDLNNVFSLLSSLYLDNKINKTQMRLKLFQSIGDIEKDNIIEIKTHHRLFRNYLFNNSIISSYIVKDVIQLYSQDVIYLLINKPHYFQEFFNNNRGRTEGFFQHFHYDGKMLYGARAIERFTFTNRYDYWQELVWNKKKVSPVVAAAKKGLYKQLNVYRTVQNLIRIDKFWESKEFINSLCENDGGAILSLDYNFWEKKISYLLKTNDSKSYFTEHFLDIVDKYLESQKFSSLCQRFLSHFKDNELLYFMEDFYNCLRGYIKHPNIIYILLSIKKWKNLNQLLIINNILSNPMSLYIILNENENINIFQDIKAYMISFFKNLKEKYLLIKNNELLSIINTIKKNILNYNNDNEYILISKSILDILIEQKSSKKYYLQYLCCFTCFLLIDIKTTQQNNNNNNNIFIDYSKILTVFNISYEPIYYEQISLNSKKRERKSHNKHNKKRKHSIYDNIHSDNDNINNNISQSGWLVESLINSKYKIQYSNYDIPRYIILYYVFKTLNEIKNKK